MTRKFPRRAPQYKSWPVALSALGFLPIFGGVPRYCEPHGPGGPGGGGAEQSAAGEAGAGGSAAGDAGAGGSAAGAPGEGGDGESGVPDRVSEPLLGCVSGLSGKLTPGAFDVLEPHFDFAAADYAWLTDWSGDGQTAVGVYPNAPVDDSDGAAFVRWRAGHGYELEAKVPISERSEAPTSVVSCDGSVEVRRIGDGSLWTNGSFSIPIPDPQYEPRFHDYLTLSEDGSSLAFFTGISDQVRPWTEWHSTRGDLNTLLLDHVESLSWDGLTAFGISICYTQTCQQPKTLRWRPLEGGEDVTTTAPTPLVAADGETIVFDYNATHLGVWHQDSLDTIDCVDACHVVAWSSRGQILLVNRGDDFAIWTQPHGFRRLSSLLSIPAGWVIVPTSLSLDGWTVTGTAGSESMPFAYFRATLKADAFQ